MDDMTLLQMDIGISLNGPREHFEKLGLSEASSVTSETGINIEFKILPGC